MLMKAQDSCLVIIDVQERLWPVMSEPDRVARRCEVLLKAANRLDVPALVSEQYPQGIGPTITPLRSLVPNTAVLEKMHFSCGDDVIFLERLAALQRPQVVVAGIEAHVCVLQSAMRFKELGYDVFVVADGCSSRTTADADTAFRRLTSSGVAVVTTEMVLFEWLHRAGTPEFKDVLKLIK